MTDISRRNLLKGIMASAGVVAVGIPLDAIAAADTVVETVPIRPITVEIGDFWIRRDGVARFIGKVTSIDMNFGYAEYFESGFRAMSIPDNTVDVDVSIFPDREGYDILYETLLERPTIEAVFGHKTGHYLIRDAYLNGVQSEVGPHGLMVCASVFGRRGAFVS